MNALAERSIQLARRMRSRLPLDIPVTPRTVRLLRATLANLGEHLPLPDDCQPLRCVVRGVPCEWFSAGHFLEKKILIWYRGGFHHVGSRGSHRLLGAELAHTTGARVLLAAPRQAPEVHCQDTVADALGVFQSLLDRGHAPEHIMLGGDDGGAALALSVIQAQAAQHRPLPAGAMLFAPWSDLTNSGKTLATVSDDLVRKSQLDTLARQWLGNTLATNPLASPRFGALAGLPPTLIVTSDRCALYSDACSLHEALLHADCDSERVNCPNQPLGWYLAGGWLASGQQALNAAAGFMQAHIATV